MVDLVAGQSYGWAGNDTRPEPILEVRLESGDRAGEHRFRRTATRFGGSGFPAERMGTRMSRCPARRMRPVRCSGPRASSSFTDLSTLGGDGKLAVQPGTLVKYNGTGRATVAALAAGPDGLYFSDLYEDSGAGGATARRREHLPRPLRGRRGRAGPHGRDARHRHAQSGQPRKLHAARACSGADDGGEGGLTYTWGAHGQPARARQFQRQRFQRRQERRSHLHRQRDLQLRRRSFAMPAARSSISNVAVTVNSVLSDTGNGLTADYFDNINFTAPVPRRGTDPAIDFNWGTGAPITGMGDNTFSVRWTGFVVPRFTRHLHVLHDHGRRRAVVGQQPSTTVIDQFVDQGADHVDRHGRTSPPASSTRSAWTITRTGAGRRRGWSGPAPANCVRSCRRGGCIRRGSVIARVPRPT